MKKIFLSLLFLFFPFFLTAHSVTAAGISLNKSGDTPEYNYGDQVTITLSDIPWSVPHPSDPDSRIGTRINISILRGGTEQKAGVSIETVGDARGTTFTCTPPSITIHNINPDAWSSIACNPQSSQGTPFTFTGILDTTKIDISPDATNDTVIVIDVQGESTCNSCFARKQFIVKAPKQSTSNLNINAVYNTTQKNTVWQPSEAKNTVKPGDKVRISFKPGTSSGDYEWGTEGPLPNTSGSCTNSPNIPGGCEVTYTIPTEAVGQSIVLFIKDKDSGETAFTTPIEVESVTPIPSGVEVTGAPPVCKAPEDVENECTGDTIVYEARECGGTEVGRFQCDDDYEYCLADGTIMCDTGDPLPPAPQCKTRSGNNSCDVVSTAIGDINTSPEGFVTRLFGVLLSISGGIAVILIIISGYQMITSQGEPEKLKEARERLTSVIVGLLFLVFSLIILEIIGVDILHLPGLT